MGVPILQKNLIKTKELNDVQMTTEPVSKQLRMHSRLVTTNSIFFQQQHIEENEIEELNVLSILFLDI